ncbi:hypothetical protein [Flavobacterium davisii]|uniref:Alpha/beta hydrolase n=1 Tax=Flavobacterium columnare TaxID=996 RepID=A0A8G0KVB1_9FLAO|nr:hypothetical protein [Flavobacterium davisii]QYS89683.1 hypothetical protein JJC05_05385 [Flavobacterium davisii]
MHYKLILLLISFTFISCKSDFKKKKVVKTKHYELTIAPHSKATLILFPCFPCDIEHTKSEAKFLKDLDKEGISTLLMDFNQKLYLSEAEKKTYSQMLNQIFNENQLDKNHIYMGGFSSGGNVSFILSNYLIATKNALKPQGVFAVDSPLDVERLYQNAKIDLKRNVNNEAIEEGKFIIQLLEEELGKPEQNIAKYENSSPYTISTHTTNNIFHLKDIKIRFYYEPALAYHKKDSGREYEELNAYQLAETHKALENLGSKKSECISTKNRGYRADGTRNPHHRNLVERQDLINWILDRK